MWWTLEGAGIAEVVEGNVDCARRWSAGAGGAGEFAADAGEHLERLSVEEQHRSWKPRAQRGRSFRPQPWRLGSRSMCSRRNPVRRAGTPTAVATVNRERYLARWHGRRAIRFHPCSLSADCVSGNRRRVESICTGGLGRSEEVAYGHRVGEVAIELAVHFERGRDYRRTVHYLRQAGERAFRRCANREAIRLLTKGLASLATLPDTPERAQQELSWQIASMLSWAATMKRKAHDLL